MICIEKFSFIVKYVHLYFSSKHINFLFTTVFRLNTVSTIKNKSIIFSVTTKEIKIFKTIL